MYSLQPKETDQICIGVSAVVAFYQCFVGSEGPMEIQVVIYLMLFLHSPSSSSSYRLRRGVHPTHLPATVPAAPCLCPSAPPQPAQPLHTRHRTAWQGSEMTCWMPSLRVRSLKLCIDIIIHTRWLDVYKMIGRCLEDDDWKMFRRWLEDV